MTVPRDTILGRLQANVDTLIRSAQAAAKGLFLSEISSPFNSGGESGFASPFLKTLFPEIRLAAMLERSLNTALGWGWDKIAGDVARATYGNAEVGYFVQGTIPATTSSQIDAIAAAYTAGDGHLVPDLKRELAQILPGVAAPGAREEVREKDDVFFVDASGTENHIEIKTPKPNYDQMRAAKRRILRIYALKHPLKVNAFVGFPYNPNGLFGQYGWPTTKYFLDDTADLKIGKDFWNYIGNSDSTYNELLDCFLEVSKARGPELNRLLHEEV